MFRIIIILVSLLTTHRPLLASEADIHLEIKKALACQVNPLKAVREIAKTASNKYGEGYTGFIFGEEMQKTAVVSLRSPIVIAEAKANNVVASTIFFYGNFIGLVHAEFTGDYKKVVTELGLQPSKDGTSFRKRMNVNLYGESEDGCPMTIELRPLENDRFVLGCGWCNG